VIFKISDILFVVEVGRNGQAAFVENAINGDVVEGDILLSTKMLLILLFTRGLIVLLKRAAALRGARLFDVPMRNERYTAERRRRGIIITVDDVGVGAPNSELAPL